MQSDNKAVNCLICKRSAESSLRSESNSSANGDAVAAWDQQTDTGAQQRLFYWNKQTTTFLFCLQWTRSSTGTSVAWLAATNPTGTTGSQNPAPAPYRSAEALSSTTALRNVVFLLLFAQSAPNWSSSAWKRQMTVSSSVSGILERNRLVPHRQTKDLTFHERIGGRLKGWNLTLLW